MKHKVLGNVRKDENRPGDRVATIEHRSRKIKIRIVPDDQPLETTVNLAADVVTRLPMVDKAAKRVIVAGLRETYNDGWNDTTKSRKTGRFKDRQEPQAIGSGVREAILT
jgi:hypothetical protein